MRHARAAVLLLPALALTLGACGGADAYCSTLSDNAQLSATVYTSVVPGMVTSEQADERLALLGELEGDVPEDLQEDFTTWQDYLEEVGPKLDSQEPEDMTAVIDAGDDEVDAAREALFDHYNSTCMD
ncbi:hypothetical protein [Brachybacterium paraconglomeratum]|uniref:hypothetical protein n=1 Tax=Brachybacterium paraconglomeratum TaxID=173362 RepID=UPI00223A9E4E|nr:hypothetical protein [Brachybacterium paraconglomeratum]MCT1436368.1 hypothetical protein [Brachybacterium paraconglomeratum]